MENKGVLIALEKAKSKISKIKANLDASGIKNCRVYCTDSSTACSQGELFLIDCVVFMKGL